MPFPGLLDLNDDALHVLFGVTALFHPPHWEFPGSGQPHDWEPDSLSEYPTYLETHRGPKFCLGWLYLSHVCRRLRQICLASPALWGGVVLALPSLSSMEHLLVRAQQAPLRLSLLSTDWRTPFANPADPYWHDYRARVAFAIKHFERAVSLEVHRAGAPHLTDWQPLLCGHPLPYLRRLAIYQPHFPSHPRRFYINAPNLVHVTLDGGTFPSFTYPLRLLRKLDISVHPRGVLSLGSNAPILNILRGTPLLEELSLRQLDIVAGGAVDERLCEQSVLLANLQTASLDVYGSGQPYLWSHIQAPAEVDLDLCFSGYAHRHDVLNIFRAALPQLRCPAYDHLIVAVTTGLVTVQAVMNHYTSLSHDRNDGVRISWQISPSSFDRRTFLLIPSCVNAARIRLLHLRMVTAEGDNTMLYSFLSAFRSTTILALDTRTRMSGSGAILRLLAENAASAHMGDTPLLLPSLSTLAVAYPSGAWQDTIQPQFLSDHWRAALAFLQARTSTGRRVRSLKLFGARPQEKALQAIERGALDWAAKFVDEIVVADEH
ncbi:hypothetical protein PENSPDRAFT_70793 [Peniophora sp. CONT]|nr:hypothetical protein PENSPDRAFT_70793 [Peniophora sp. CONT]